MNNNSWNGKEYLLSPEFSEKMDILVMQSDSLLLSRDAGQT
jgi:hypothetical protein